MDIFGQADEHGYLKLEVCIRSADVVEKANQGHQLSAEVLVIVKQPLNNIRVFVHTVQGFGHYCEHLLQLVVAEGEEKRCSMLEAGASLSVHCQDHAGGRPAVPLLVRGAVEE